MTKTRKQKTTGLVSKYPGSFLVDLSTQAVLYAAPMTPQFGMAVITELRRISFNTIIRTVQFDSPVIQFANQNFTLNNLRRWKEDRWNSRVELVELEDLSGELAAKKTLIDCKASVIKNMLFISYLILGEYALGYGDIDYDSAVNYALNNETLLDEYGIANNLTREQAQRELSFDYHERQTKKFRLYAYQRKFLNELRLASSVDAVNEIRKNIQDHFWKNGFV